MATLETIKRIKSEVETELLSLPGVTGVDVGRKEVGGKPTDTLAIRVYVVHKRDVPKLQALPRFIGGIPTDVIESRIGLIVMNPQQIARFNNQEREHVTGK